MLRDNQDGVFGLVTERVSKWAHSLIIKRVKRTYHPDPKHREICIE